MFLCLDAPIQTPLETPEGKQANNAVGVLSLA